VVVAYGAAAGIGELGALSLIGVVSSMAAATVAWLLWAW